MELFVPLRAIKCTLRLTSSKINVFPFCNDYFVLRGSKMDLLDPQGEIKFTWWPGSIKKYLFLFGEQRNSCPSKSSKWFDLKKHALANFSGRNSIRTNLSQSKISFKSIRKKFCTSSDEKPSERFGLKIRFQSI